MGGSMGSPIGDSEEARINELIKEIVEKFTINYPINFTLAVVEKVKEESNPDKPWTTELKLLEAPLPDKEIKKGTMKKRGGIGNKSEKTRHFIARNAADKFRVDYYEKEGGKLKGSINCAGYYVSDFDEVEKGDYGPFGFKLRPYSSRRRTWILMTETKEQMDEWKPVFATACWKAEAPEDKNPLIASAFVTTLQQLRYDYGFYGYYYSWGTESERLQDFITCAIAYQVVDAIFDAMPSTGMGYWQIYEATWSGIASAVRVAVEPAWQSVCAASNASQPTLYGTIKENAGPLFDKQRELKDQVVDKITSLTTPFVSMVGDKFLRPVLNKCTKNISKAFADSLRGMSHVIRAKHTSGDLAPGKVQAACSDLTWKVDWWWEKPNGDSYRLISDLCWNHLIELNPLFQELGDFSVWTIYNSANDKLHTIGYRGVYTLGKLIADGVEVEAAIARVLNRYLHDCKVMIRQIIKEIFSSMLDSLVTTTIRNPSKELIAPIADVIAAIPVLSTLLNLNDLLDEAISDIVDNAIDTVIESGTEDVAEHLDEVKAELSVGEDF